MYKQVETIINQEYSPYYTSVTDQRGVMKIVVASNKFKNMGSDERVRNVESYLGLIPGFKDTRRSLFIMTEDEYRHAVRCPAFVGV